MHLWAPLYRRRWILFYFFSNIFFSDIEQQSACAVAYGFASKSHLALVTEKLEALLKAEFSKKRGMGPSSFFGFMRDHKLEDEQLATRCTILRCVGSAAFKGQDLKSKVSWTCYFTIFTYSRSNASSLLTERFRRVIPNFYSRVKDSCADFGVNFNIVQNRPTIKAVCTKISFFFAYLAIFWYSWEKIKRYHFW